MSTLRYIREELQQPTVTGFVARLVKAIRWALRRRKETRMKKLGVVMLALWLAGCGAGLKAKVEPAFAVYGARGTEVGVAVGVSDMAERPVGGVEAAAYAYPGAALNVLFGWLAGLFGKARAATTTATGS